jgi:hypothetical protein
MCELARRASLASASERAGRSSASWTGILRFVWHFAHRVVALAPLCLVAGIAAAETLTVGGMSFSDEPGGARLLSASGTGTRDDPLVLVEEIIGPGPAVLEIRNGRTGHLDVSPATGFLTLSVVKIIVNRGPWRWTGFDLELLTGPDQPSVYSDGLSFDQPQTFQRLARADRFLQTVQDDEPFDRIRFDGGQVDPAEYLRLDFDIVDVNGTATFYLVQRPLVLLAWDPPRRSAHDLAAYSEPLRVAPAAFAHTRIGLMDGSASGTIISIK